MALTTEHSRTIEREAKEDWPKKAPGIVGLEGSSLAPKTGGWGPKFKFEAVAVRVVAAGADFAGVAEGEGEQDWVADFGDGYAGADFAHVARAFVA